MNEESIFKPYLKLYGQGVHQERPWWRYIPNWGGQLERADGKVEPITRIEEVDREQPMPKPPVWPGQCWADAYGRTFFVVGKTAELEWVLGGTTALMDEVCTFHRDQLYGSKVVQGDIVALLYGPSIYGRDVPWSRG